MAGKTGLKLYDWQEETRPGSQLKVLPIELQPFHNSTEFDLGSIVELHYRGRHGSPRNPANNYSVGYVVESRKPNGKKAGRKYKPELIKLSKELPEKRFFNATLSLPKDCISEFQLLAVPDAEAGYSSFRGSLPPEKFQMGAILEILEYGKNGRGSSPGKRKVGYITRLGSDSIGISMDHPSNVGSFSVRNMMKIPHSKIHNYRVLGQRDLQRDLY